MRSEHSLPILAVLGPGRASTEEIAIAEQIGGMAARAGWVVLTGGGPGVMEAACRGAVEEGGTTVGILPTAAPEADYPNQWVQISVFTGAGAARNAFNVLSGDLCVAIGGGPGTLSEIALAVKTGARIWCWRSWTTTPPVGVADLAIVSYESSDELVTDLAAELAKGIEIQSA